MGIWQAPALPPLGAARETLPADEWQPVVGDWMERSTLVLFAAPPAVGTPGLVWELGRVTEGELWFKTLLVMPPVPADQLRRRWGAFTRQLSGMWPFNLPLPTDPANVLVLTVADHAWTALIADDRSEWSYAAALAEIACRLPSDRAGLTALRPGGGESEQGRVETVAPNVDQWSYGNITASERAGKENAMERTR